MKNPDLPEETQEERVDTVNLEKAKGAGIGTTPFRDGIGTTPSVRLAPQGTASDDGSVIVSDPGVGIRVSG